MITNVNIVVIITVLAIIYNDKQQINKLTTPSHASMIPNRKHGIILLSLLGSCLQTTTTHVTLCSRKGLNSPWTAGP